MAQYLQAALYHASTRRTNVARTTKAQMRMSAEEGVNGTEMQMKKMFSH